MKAVLRAGVTVLVMLPLALGSQAAVEVTNYWDHNIGGNWSDTHTNGAANNVPGWSDINGDGLGDVPDDANLADGTNVIARFVPMSGGKTITLDSQRTVARLWYNSNSMSAASSIYFASSGGSVLTLASEGGTPEINLGYRFLQTNATVGMTIDATLGGTQGFTIAQPGNPYAGFGLVLGGTNPVSGLVSGYRMLTLRSTQALQNATLQLAAGSTLRLRHDTDGATFRTAGLPQTGSTSAMIVNVGRDTAAGLSNHTLKLSGDYTTPGRGLQVTGTNGYRLEITGNYSNSYGTGRVPAITADSANLIMSGGTFYTGVGGIQLGGALATGTNEIRGAVSGIGPLVKLADPSCWLLTGNNTGTDTTTIAGGTLALAGSGTISSSAAITVLGGATLDATGAAPITRSAGQTLRGEGVILGNVILATNSTLTPGTNTIATLTVTGNVTEAGSWLADVNGANFACDVLAVDGNVTLESGSRLVLNTNGPFNGVLSLTLARYSGTLTGSFSVTSNVPPTYRIDYGTRVNSAIRLIKPVPGGTIVVH
jgi:hypothetical protein